MAKILWPQNWFIEFYGVMSISAVLKKHGHESEILFGSKEEIVESIRRINPTCIAFSCMSIQWKWAKEVSTFIKQSGIETPIIVGGIHASMFPEDAISHPDIDVVCINEGEIPMLEFVQALESGQDYSTIDNLWVRKPEKIIKNCARPKMTSDELTDSPFADRALYKKYDHFVKYPFEIFVGSRGCPFKCTFCEVPEINTMYGGKSVYYVDPERLVDEIEEAKGQGLLDGKTVLFTDSTFNSNKKWFLRFLDEYRRRLSIPFSCNLRLDLVDETQVKALKESGCDNVRLGIEAGDYDIRKRILGKTLKDEHVYKATDLLHKYEIPFMSYNLLASPEETYDQAWKTIRINQKINPAACLMQVFVLFPGLQATNYALEKNLIEKEDLDLIENHPYNIDLSLLTKHPERNPDALKICNLQKFAILAVRLPFLEPIIRLLVKLPPLSVFTSIYSISTAWEFRKWSSRITFWRMLYEGILNYKAMVKTNDEGGIVGKISLMLGNRVKRKTRTAETASMPGTSLLEIISPK
jgi:anaerobic magnesium-protoporphyrin IX monomethyl ester cyclase